MDPPRLRGTYRMAPLPWCAAKEPSKPSSSLPITNSTWSGGRLQKLLVKDKGAVIAVFLCRDCMSYRCWTATITAHIQTGKRQAFTNNGFRSLMRPKHLAKRKSMILYGLLDRKSIEEGKS